MKILRYLSFIPFSAIAAFAGTLVESKNMISEPAVRPQIEYSYKVGVDYVAESDFNDENLGNQDAAHAALRLAVAIPLTDSFYLSLNAFYDRLDFGTSRAPVPTTLQQLGLAIGLQYRVDRVTGFEIAIAPGYYGSDISQDSFNAPLYGYLLHRLNADLVLVGGFRYNAWSEYPILPLVGFVWKVTDKVKVDATYPNPQIEYALNTDTTVTFGGEFVAGTYKTARSERNFSRQNLDYTDYRAAFGVQYTGWNPLEIQMRIGWSFQREFRYDDADKEYKTDGAPFVSVSASAKF